MNLGLKDIFYYCEHNILDSLIRLSDKVYQEDVWLGKGIIFKDYNDTYEESMNMLYDDFSFIEYIEACKNTKSKDVFGGMLMQVNYILKNFDPVNTDGKTILEDPEWQMIRNNILYVCKTPEFRRVCESNSKCMKNSYIVDFLRSD